MMIPIVLLNQQRLVREGWAGFLSEQPGICVVGDTGDPQEACQLVRRYKPRIVLASDDLITALDFKQLAEIHESYLPAGMILVLSHFSHGIQEHLSRLGVRACLSRYSSLAEMLTAIAKVNGGKTYASDTLREAVGAAREGDVHETLRGLTARELEIAGMLVKGRTSKEVASSLGISYKTVEVHRHNILIKMRCKNTNMLAHRLSCAVPPS
ncbi:MAG TPA: response regulator transcription factor [Puia sp.]|nr:response regulator transcription factor [Puia sp.]